MYTAFGAVIDAPLNPSSQSPPVGLLKKFIITIYVFKPMVYFEDFFFCLL